MRCTPCRAVSLTIASPVLLYVGLLLLCACMPSPTPHDVEQDALVRLLEGESVTRVYANKSPASWQRTHFALTLSLNTTARTLCFPHSNQSLSLDRASHTPVELTVHLGDTYSDAWFSPADDVLLWVATRPLAGEEFEGWLPALVAQSDDAETGERVVELRAVAPASSGPYLRDEPSALPVAAERWFHRGPSLLTLVFPNSTAASPTAVYYPSLHVANDWRGQLDQPDSESRALADVLAPSTTLPLRLALIRIFGPFTLTVGRAIDSFGWIVGMLLDWGFKMFLGGVVWMACSQPLSKHWKGLRGGKGAAEGRENVAAGAGSKASAPKAAATAQDREKQGLVEVVVVATGDEFK